MKHTRIFFPTAFGKQKKQKINRQNDSRAHMYDYKALWVKSIPKVIFWEDFFEGNGIEGTSHVILLPQCQVQVFSPQKSVPSEDQTLQRNLQGVGKSCPILQIQPWEISMVFSFSGGPWETHLSPASPPKIGIKMEELPKTWCVYPTTMGKSD